MGWSRGASARIRGRVCGLARVDEGLTLRLAGISTPTVLLEGVFNREQLDAAAGAILKLVLATPEQIELLRSAATGVRFKVWLKLDSGMNRLGFKGAAFWRRACGPECLGAGVQLPVNLFTHLASADLPELPTTAEQLALFAAATGSLSGERSLENSAAMLSYRTRRAIGCARAPALRRFALRRLHRSRLWIAAGHDPAFARDRSQGTLPRGARGLWRRLDRQPSHPLGGRSGGLRDDTRAVWIRAHRCWLMANAPAWRAGCRWT